jgi:hypothetical protein
VQLQRPRGDAGREQVVLDLLVDDDDDEHPQGADGVVQQGDEHGQHPGEVGADDGEELGDQADPDAEGHRVPQPDDGERRGVEDRREEGQQRPRVEVAARLVDGQLPGVQDPFLAIRLEPPADDPPQPRAVGDHVEGQEQDGQDLQQPAEELRGERDRVVGQRTGQLPLVDAVDEVAEVE